jgi:DMSO/TMAO reductase YedYZ molybdopterin-dependent catalytic subunit
MATLPFTSRLHAPGPADFRSPLHDQRVLARLGACLGGCLVTCFVTGLISHYQQHPVAWLPLGSDPAWGYRVTQGLHVVTGTAMLPLLLAKLYAAYPRLFTRPVRSIAFALEKLGIAVLIAATAFQLITGLTNVAQWYPWGFGFTGAHQAVAWLAFGGLAVHVAVSLPVIRTALTAPLADADQDAPLADADQDTDQDAASDVAGVEYTDPNGRTRRGFLLAVAAVTGGVTLLTAGQTVYPLRRFALLAPRRPDVGPQGLPVNRTAIAAGVTAELTGPRWRLELIGPDGARALTRAELAALPQHRVDLPIACVEGWSAQASWTGVRIRDLVRLVGGEPHHTVRVESLEQHGGYQTTTLPAAWADDPRTLLAMQLNGETLELDHGSPARLIAPNRPGVLQTKWIRRLTVLDEEQA